tara:strand:+ start:3008 stop:4093 length:1086 start_codon:yes stop_codon:yes gene_type:complete
MKRLIALMICAVSLGAAAQIEYPFPYNPDSDNSGWIGLSDLLSLLAVYNTDFEPSSWQTDSLSAHVDLGETMTYLECINACNKLPGAWRLVSLDEFGRALDIASPTPNDYWISSNISLRNERLMVADASGVIDFNSVSSTANDRGCMCYIRAQATMVQTISANSGESHSQLEEFELRIDSLAQSIDSLSGQVLFEGQGVAMSASQITCLEVGLSPACSPQAGLCSDTTSPDNDGRYPLTNYCPDQYDQNYCYYEPHWRKFRLSGLNLEDVVEIFLVERWKPQPNGFGGYYGRQDVFSADVYEVTNSSLVFYAGFFEPTGGFDFLQLGESSYSGDDTDALWGIALKKANGEIFNVSPRIWFK